MNLKTLSQSHQFARLAAFVTLLALLAYGVLVHAKKDPPVTPVPNPKSFWTNTGPVKMRAALSQNKVLQGSDGMIYLQIDLEADKAAESSVKERRPTDFIVVLDRSGSMSGDKKMTYALSAIESLIRQLHKDDRFALVTFDSIIESPIELSAVNSDNRDKLIATVREITPRGSTNLGGGLTRGIDIIRAASKNSGKAQRLILLSDGQANEGITDPTTLGKIASQAAASEYVISTIGVGLDFNETLLSSLADHGTGNYHFLEDLAALDKVLAGEFYAASRILAKGLTVTFDLASGVQVISASGYPVMREKGATVVQPGHLYHGQQKTLFATLKLPTDQVYVESLGSVVLSYREVNGDEETARTVTLLSTDVKVACLPEEKKAEVTASVDKEVYTSAWTQNNFGEFLKDNAGSISEGDKGGSERKVKEFREKITKAYSQAPSPALKQTMDDLEEVAKESDDAFTGADAPGKQKGLSKSYQYDGRNKQRTK